MRAIMILLLLWLNGCNFNLMGDCTKTIKSEVGSPDGKYIATVYERDCGATTDFSTSVNLRQSGIPFSGKEGDVFTVQGELIINLFWEGSTSLRVNCAKCEDNDVFKREVSWQEIGIHYE